MYAPGQLRPLLQTENKPAYEQRNLPDGVWNRAFLVSIFSFSDSWNSRSCGYNCQDSVVDFVKWCDGPWRWNQTSVGSTVQWRVAGMGGAAGVTCYSTGFVEWRQGRWLLFLTKTGEQCAAPAAAACVCLCSTGRPTFHGCDGYFNVAIKTTRLSAICVICENPSGVFRWTTTNQRSYYIDFRRARSG